MKKSGWCPVHDRVYETKDGLCPDCDTPLVSLTGPHPGAGAGPIRPEADVAPATPDPAAEESRPPDPVALDEPLWASTGIIAAMAAAIIALAFLSGLAWAHVSRARRAAPDKAPLAAADITVGTTRTRGAIALRLDSFTQRGATVVLRVGVITKDPSIDIGLIQGVTVAFISANEEIARVQLPTRATTSGFIAGGGIPDIATKPVTEVRIASLTVGLPGSSGAGTSGGKMEMDLRGVWPVKAGTPPRVNRAGTSRKLDDGRTVRLDSVVGWPDRIEARLVVAGQRFNWDYNETYTLAFPAGLPPLVFAPVGGKVQPEGTSASVRYVDFFGVDPRATEAELQIDVSDVTITGDWDWNLTP